MQGTHHAVVVEQLDDLVDPGVVLGIEPFVQGGAELGAQGAGLVVLGGAVGRGDHGPEVTDVDHVGLLQGSLGPVLPLGGPDLGEQLLGEGQDGAFIDGRGTLGLAAGSFCFASAWRTAWRPPWCTSWATGFCSSGERRAGHHGGPDRP